MKIYSGVMSMFGAKAELAALEKRIHAEVELVPFSLSTLYEPKHPEVLRINPKAQVPVLVDGDLELYDSTQIFEYFEELVPAPPLWPAATRARANARRFELWSDEVFFPNVVQLFPHNRRRDGEDKAREALEAIERAYAHANRVLGDRAYVADALSYADLAFFPAQYWATVVGAPPAPSYSAIAGWKARMAERESVRAVIGRAMRYLGEQGLTPPPLSG